MVFGLSSSAPSSFALWLQEGQAVYSWLGWGIMPEAAALWIDAALSSSTEGDAIIGLDRRRNRRRLLEDGYALSSGAGGGGGFDPMAHALGGPSGERLGELGERRWGPGLRGRRGGAHVGGRWEGYVDVRLAEAQAKHDVIERWARSEWGRGLSLLSLFQLLVSTAKRLRLPLSCAAPLFHVCPDALLYPRSAAFKRGFSDEDEASIVNSKRVAAISEKWKASLSINSVQKVTALCESSISLRGRANAHATVVRTLRPTGPMRVVFWCHHTTIFRRLCSLARRRFLAAARLRRRPLPPQGRARRPPQPRAPDPPLARGHPEHRPRRLRWKRPRRRL